MSNAMNEEIEHRLRVEVLTIEKQWAQVKLESEVRRLDMTEENDLIYKESKKAEKEKEYVQFMSYMLIQKEEFLKAKDENYSDNSGFVKYSAFFFLLCSSSFRFFI